MDGAAAVFHGVGQRVQDRELASGKYYRYGNVRQHKGQHRRGISHRICAVKDHNAVIVPMLFVDGFCQLLPVFRLDIGAVQLEKFQKIYTGTGL